MERFISVPMNDHQFSALVSLTFNIGNEAFRRSTLRRKLNEGDYTGAADQFLVWNKTTVGGKKVVAKGLVTRRAKERDLFKTPFVASAPVQSRPPSPTIAIPGKPEPAPVGQHGGLTVAFVGIAAALAAAWAWASGILERTF